MIYSLPNRVFPRISNLLSCIIFNVLAVMLVIWEKRQHIYLDTKIDEHLNKASAPSTIFKHLKPSETCNISCHESCFKVIDKFTLKVK